MRTQLFRGLLVVALLIISCTALATKTIYNYGCQGSASITVGQEVTLYQPFPSSAWNCQWYLRSTRNNISVGGQSLGGAKIISSTNSSCTIKGISSTNSDTQLQLYCEHKGYSDDSDEYVCYFDVTVRDVLITSITLNPSSVALNVGDTQRVTYTIQPSNATETVNASSDKKDVATVQWDNGVMVIRAISPGTATITCKGKQSGTSSTCQVTVSAKPVPVESVTLSSTSISLVKNEYKWLTATVKPDNATNKSVTWSSSNDNVAQVSDGGRVEGIGKGTATITCKANDGSGVKATCDVTIFNYGNYSCFTAKTIEGVDMQFYVNKYDSGECGVISPAIDANTVGTITIPNEVEGYKVTKIYSDAFKSCKGITKVTIPSSVESIENYAFSDCSGLTTITIPNSVTTIGNSAFSRCTSLTTVALGNGVKSIGSWAFNNCTSLTTLTGINNLESIGEFAFRDTPWSDNLPDGLIYLGKVLYRYNGTMPDNTTIDVKEGTKSLGASSICQQDGLVALNIPVSLREIAENAVYHCKNLASISVASGNEVFDSRNGCNAIVDTKTNTVVLGGNKTTFPSTVKAIGKKAFYGSGIVEMVIPSNIDSIAEYAFENNNLLTQVVIGNGVRVIGLNPFEYCLKLRSISVMQDNPYYDSRQNCNAIIEKSTAKLIVGCPATIIPETVKIIDTGAFSTSYYDFYTIDIPNSVESIKNAAFSGFQNEYLRSITIGTGVKEIRQLAFYRCAKVRAVHCYQNTPTETSVNAFMPSTYKDATLYVPIGSRMNYMSTTEWNKFQNIEETDWKTPCSGDIIDSAEHPFVFSIVSNKDNTCELVCVKSQAWEEKSLTIPSQVNEYTVTEIGLKAFSVCNNLSTLVSHIKSPFPISENVFNKEMFTSVTLYVPVGTKALYKETEGWKNFSNIIEGEPAIEPEPTLKGDVNEDEKVNGTDLVALTNIILGKSPEKASADVNGDGKVNGTDYVALANIILGKAASRSATADDMVVGGSAMLEMEAFAIGAGETSELVINLTNLNDALTLLQFDMVLPKGLSVQPTMAGRTNPQRHQLTAYENGNEVRFLLASSSNELIEDTEGAVIRMTVTADAGFNGGVIALQGVLGVSPDEQEVYMPTRQYDLIGGTTGIYKIGVGQNGSTVYNLSGQRQAALKKGVNIVDGKKVVKK